MHKNKIAINYKNRTLHLALMGALIGIFAFLCVHTYQSLNVTYDAWILDGYVEKDIIQHYTGWLFYRDAPISYPLGISTSMQYPTGTAVTFTDSVPLFAIFFRLLSGILPATFQYFGIFTLCCYALMGSGAAMLLGLFTSSNTCAVLGSVLYVTYPILTERAFRHTALAAQFFIVFAFYLYFLNRKSGFKLRKAWLLLTALSATIHPYFLPMVFAILLADLAQNAIETKTAKAWRNNMLFLALNGAVTLATLFSIGAFYAPASEGISGYSYFCLNLNALYNPVSRGANGDIIWSQLISPQAQGLGTYDGFNYLGLGVITFGIIALAICIFKTMSNKGENLPILISRIKRHRVLICVCGILTVFAISNVIVLNGEVLFSIPIPEFLSNLGNTFRSSGRMFWASSYLLLTCLIVFWVRIFQNHKKQLAYGALIALIAVQLWDISPALLEKRQAFTNPTQEFENPMEATVWETLGENYSHVFSLDDILNNALYPALWAAQNGMTTNDGFTARFNFEAHSEDVKAETENLLNGIFREDTIYLTCDYIRFAQIADALIEQNANVTCAWIDSTWYAIIPDKQEVVLPTESENFAIYPDFPLMVANLTDANWSDGVLNNDNSICIFYDGKTARNIFDNSTKIVCENKEYKILNVDYSDENWVMVTLDIENAKEITGKHLTGK